MIRRKIQLSGKLTYVVSLPKKWVEKTGLKKGDEIIIYPQDDNTLLLSPAVLPTEIKKRDITLDVTGKPMDHESLERLLISYYEAGYDTIRILNKHVITEELREGVRKVLRKLSGLEIIEESAKEIILQSFLDVTQIKVEKTLERMEIILKSMMSDLIFAIEEENKKVLRNLMYRDDELDKFYSLLSKQVSVALKSKKIAEKIGFKNQSLILPYKAYGKCLEAMGDIISLMCRVIEAEEIPVNLPMLKKSKEIMKNAIDAFRKDCAESEKRVAKLYSEFLNEIEIYMKDKKLKKTALLEILLNNFCIDIIEICAQKRALET